MSRPWSCTREDDTDRRRYDRGIDASRLPDSPHALAPGAEDRLRAFLAGERPSDREEPATRALLKRLVPRPAMDPARNAMTRALRPVARRRIEDAARRTPLNLHLGSGFEYKAGWVNIDRAPIRVDVPWHLADGIPFADASADAVFHEHLLEHLTLPQGEGLLRETLRVLRPGGVLRIGVPDAGAVVQSYAGNAGPEWALSAPTPMIAVQRLFYDHGHRAMYDGQTLTLLFRAVGFAEVRRCAFGESRLSPVPDTPARRDGTLYVEGIRPGGALERPAP